MAKSISESRDGLKRVFPNSKVSARQLNALIDAVLTRNPVEAGTTTDQFGQHRRPRVQTRGNWVHIKSDIDMPAFGIAEVYDGFFGEDGQFAYLVRTPTATGNLFIANEDFPLVAGAEGWARLVTAGDPVQVRADSPLQFMTIANTIVGNDTISTGVAGSLLVVASSETTTGTFRTGVIPFLGGPGIVGKTQGTVAQGQFGLVDIYAPRVGTVVESWDDLENTGETQEALFLFGIAPSTPAWVGLIDNAWAWTAYVIECVGP